MLLTLDVVGADMPGHPPRRLPELRRQKLTVLICLVVVLSVGVIVCLSIPKKLCHRR
jgi:hypothetical protein